MLLAFGTERIPPEPTERTNEKKRRLLTNIGEEEALPVLMLRMTSAMRLAVTAAVLAANVPMARAEPPTPVRMIEITRDNAERSAAAIAAARSPFIGVPPRGKLVRSTSQWQDARAEAPEDEADVARQDALSPASVTEIGSDRAVVLIIKPGKSGPLVETYVVPRGR